MLGPAAWAGAGALGWAAVAYLALFSTILAYVCWYWALRRGGIARIGATQFVQPVIALAFAVMVLGEPLTPLFAVSAAIIVVGVAIAQRRQRSASRILTFGKRRGLTRDSPRIRG